VIQTITLKKPLRLSRYEERELSEKARAGDIAAKHQLTLSCLPWAVEHGKRFGNSMDPDDRLSAAMEGLVRAVDTFNPGKGRLTTLVAKCVQNTILAERVQINGPSRVGQILRDAVENMRRRVT